MKNAIITFITVLLLVSCSDKKAETNTKITGNIKGLSDGMLYLKKMNDSLFVAIDSLKMKGDTKFQFDFNLDSPEVMYLVIDRGITKSIDNELPLFVEPGTLNVDTELNHFYSSAKVTGSKNHELFQQFQKINNKYKTEQLEISKERFDAVRFKRLRDLDSIDNKLNNKVARQYLYAVNFALTNKDFEVAPYIALSELANANVKFLDTIHNSLSSKVSESRYGKLFTEYLKERKKSN